MHKRNELFCHAGQRLDRRRQRHASGKLCGALRAFQGESSAQTSLLLRLERSRSGERNLHQACAISFSGLISGDSAHASHRFHDLALGKALRTSAVAAAIAPPAALPGPGRVAFMQRIPPQGGKTARPSVHNGLLIAMRPDPGTGRTPRYAVLACTVKPQRNLDASRLYAAIYTLDRGRPS